MFDIPYTKWSGNIGDDIIAYSAYYQLCKCGLDKDIVEKPTLRENLYDLQSGNRNVVVGWMSHSDKNKLPDDIDKGSIIMYGIHLTNENRCKQLMQSCVEHDIEIGCRDTHTYNLCQKAGVKSYMSYCPTLLLDKCHVEGSNYCTVVDIYDETIINHIKRTTGLEVNWITHRDYFNHYRTFSERMVNAKRHLQMYTKSRFVISNRLHVMLPCLSMGVPCLFYRHESGWDSSRLSDYYPFFNMFDNLEQLRQFDLNDIKNKDISKLTTSKNKLVQFITGGNQT